jgi:hypothetical protein
MQIHGYDHLMHRHFVDGCRKRASRAPCCVLVGLCTGEHTHTHTIQFIKALMLTL